MIELLSSIDLEILHFMNQTIANPIFDFVMSTITNVKYWIPLYVIGLSFLLVKGGTKGRILAILLLVGVLVSDTVSSKIIKKIVKRERPCKVLDNSLRLPIGCVGGKSFPSSHAFNNFCAAMIIGMFYRKRRILFFSIASVIALTRPYLGVHYPSDILAGALLGALIGYFLAVITQKIVFKYKRFNVFE